MKLLEILTALHVQQKQVGLLVASMPLGDQPARDVDARLLVGK